MAKTAIDQLGWLINLIATFFISPIWNGINRVLRGRIIWGILYFITAGFFGIGWIIDFVCIILYKQIKFLA